MATLTDAAAGSPATAGASPTTPSVAFSVAAASQPAFDGDAPDPDIVTDGSVYYAFTTGTALGNHIQVLVDTSGTTTTGWHSTSGEPYGSSALPVVPAWEQADTQTSPGVFYRDGRWIMYYDAAQRGHAGDTGYDCLSVATATSLSPTDAVFTDTSSQPLLCQPGLGGAIDPSPFIDTHTGIGYLQWKSNDGGSSRGSSIWSQQLSADGLSLVGSPTDLLDQDSVSFPWESTVEDPQMIEQGGVYLLLFSAGLWDSVSYSEAYVVCASPTSQCNADTTTQVLFSSAATPGTGGGSLFRDLSDQWMLAYTAWRPGCTNYACGGARRLLVASVTFNTDSYRSMAATPSGDGYWLVDSDGTVTAYGGATLYGSMAGLPLASPITQIVSAPDGGGYWLVAGDGGVFAFGDARFLGSMGGHPLNAPVVGLTSTSDGNGYWLFASDGGVFAFGDALFRGSMGGTALNAPVVDMASDAATGGYREVASDGGIFSFDAPFDGSMGGTALNAPIVGMAPDAATGGYWEVAADGGIFSFDATFEGAAPLHERGQGHASEP